MFKFAARLAAVAASLLCLAQAQAAISISSARVWPAQDYTRLTLESSKPISYKLFTVSNPNRLVVDLDNVALHGPLDGLAAKIGDNDPYIKSARVGQFKAGVVRLVLDLKTEVKPQLFNLKPVGAYGHRLVLDVYPAAPVDPLMALVSKPEERSLAAAASAPAQATAPPTASSVEATAQAHLAPPEPPAAGPSAKADKAVPAKAPASPNSRTLLIAIDAGHGGEDPGAHGRRGTLEKNVTLAIAHKLKALVDNTEGMRGILIRDGDYFIPLGGRVEKARNANADLFVSIHADAYIKPNASGSSVFALSEHGATSAAAKWLATKENEADLVGGVNLNTKDPYLTRTLLDLSQTATIADSLKLARHVLRELGGINNLHRGFVEQAGFAVLKSPVIPSILVETAFISNPAEERRLKDPDYQEKVARAILGGLKRYFAQNPALSKPRVARAD